MKKSCSDLAIAVVSCLSFAQSVAFAGCYESGGGELQSGRAQKSKLLEPLIDELGQLTQENADTQMYVVQTPDKYYLKVCNEEQHKIHFRTVYGLRGDLANCQLVCNIPSSIGNGIYSYERRATSCPSSCSSACYRKCEVH